MENRGTARIHGEIGLEGFFPNRRDLKGSFHDFKAVERSGSEVFASGTATLTGPWTGARLQGNFVLTRATFRTTFFQTGEHDDIVLVREAEVPGGKKIQAAKAGKPGVYRDLSMAVPLAAPEGVWVRSKSLRVKLAGSIQAGKAKGEDAPYAKGFLQVKEGSVPW